MSEKIRLSVIMPVYNLAEFLPAALDSLRGIDFPEGYEILAVDDGSTDRSPEILREAAEKDGRVRVIRQANGGVSRARNAGIEAARGDYLAFVDGDDTVNPDFFREAVREAETGGYGIVQGNTRYLEGGKVQKRLPGSRRMESGDPEEIAEWFFGRSETLMFSSCAKVFRREAVGANRFPEGIRVAEDQEFVFGVLQGKPKVLILDMDAYDYMMRGSSVTHADYAEKGWDALEVLARCGERTESPKIRKYIEKRKTDVLVRIYNTAFLSGESPARALEELRGVDIRAIRDVLTKKEYGKLVLLQKLPAAYNALLKAVKG